MTRRSTLKTAKQFRNDEFYTRLIDIEDELSHYDGHFRGKIVYCNCDDPTRSNFWRYFHLNFASLGLKKLISTHYDPKNPSYKMEYTGGDDGDISAGVRTDLEGDGDFRSRECIEILMESDIVVTNAPFSLWRDHVAQLIEYGKKFLIIGNVNAITYKDFFPLLKENKAWSGYAFNRKMLFSVPEGHETTAEVDGERFALVPGICWYTNLDHPKRHEPLPLSHSYAAAPERYPVYHNYPAINVDRTEDIPVDYNGVAGVPISFMGKYCPEQFEIVGFRKGEDGKDLVFTRDGKSVQPYFRVLIRRRLQSSDPKTIS